MTEHVKNRTIRPTTRLEKSKSYKVDTRQVLRGDTLVVNINHESKPFHKTFKFSGVDVAQKKSISFRITESKTAIDINWSGAQPLGTISIPKKIIQKQPQRKTLNPSVVDLKTSFDPVANTEIQILILGTMPGDKSLELKEYYAHPRNRFWKIIAAVTNSITPINYSDKKQLLLTNQIGIWDVAHKVNRKGSLDSNIEDEVPNDLNTFISKHKKLRIIGFNGGKSEVLFDKYFSRQSTLKYLSLPSTSPANTGITFDDICKIWREIQAK